MASSTTLSIIFMLISCSLLLVAAVPPLNPRTCPKHEVYLTCGGSCQTECATLGDPCLIRHIRCPDGCYCKENFARNAAGACIPISQCKRRGGSSYSN
ncbi:CG42259 [Drosophila busckii]|uniref:CG42259 n=1 Tax=Drosophila busckii TaxID=30019 RepID=A0A0M4EX10_DROBS|nr:inducible metalloproteinase inhibitor protein [Drosophila busckii]ALC48167.1 CG42259 [Drosophila busckii]